MTVIVLNGASSSGKSSIAKELQVVLPENYLHIGIDSFISMMPERSNNLTVSDKPSEGFYWQTQFSGVRTVQRIQSGQYGAQVSKAYRSTVRHLIDSGLKVIVDDVMNGANEQVLWVKALKGLDVVYIAVICSDAVLVEREKQRRDRIEGSALEQNHRVHVGVNYDLEVSTVNYSAGECALKIASHITNHSS